MAPTISYAQRFEDLYLMRCFGDRTNGFYIDIGSGHPVYDNVSFAFYLKGWSGITVEPNPWLAQLSRAVRPRDRHVEALVGSASGQATFYLVREFHGLSTMNQDHAQAALTQFGKSADAITVPLTTLSALCAAGQAPASFDFLKIDVEGAEPEVLFGGDWQRFRPKVVVVEALAPYTLAPAFAQWEPFLAQHGYGYVWFDSLNRYYLAQEAGELAGCFADAPATFDDAAQYRDTRPALGDPEHPDHRLAALFRDAVMTRLPVLDPALLLELMTSGLPAAALDRRADPADLARIWARLFGTQAAPAIASLRLPADASVRSLYAAIAETDQFRAACGRISASYGW
jgi:FkbM family methyltransferase